MTNASPIALSKESIELLFMGARTHTAWLPKPIDDQTLRDLYDLMKWGPTSANTLPLRIIFVKSQQAKEQLTPCLSPGNVDKTKAAPVTAILAWDDRFYEHI